MRAAQNRGIIEGTLSEIKLDEATFKKNGSDQPCIRGSVRVVVPQEHNGIPETNEITVNVFSAKYKNDGTANPSYEQFYKVLHEFKSIAATGNEEEADKIRLEGVSLRQNAFKGRDGRVVSTTRLMASFARKVTSKFTPQATFTLEFVYEGSEFATDAEGVELDPPKLNVHVAVPQFNGTIEELNLVAYSADAIDVVSKNWNVGYTYKVIGRIRHISTVSQVAAAGSFGEPMNVTRTISEYIITGGQADPYDDEVGFDFEEVKTAIAAHREELKKLADEPAKPAQAPAVSKGARNLGF